MRRSDALHAITVLVMTSGGAYALSPGGPEVDPRSPVQRSVRPAELRDGGRDGAARPGGTAVFPLEFRTITGEGNNPVHPEWGVAGTNLMRALTCAYEDGVSLPARASGPSARAVSNAVCAQGDADMPNSLGLSDFIWQWGQFLDHDITETPLASPGEPFDIAVPLGDPWFDPMHSGTATIPLNRSAWAMVDGVREQFNNITAYIDASNVYGSEEERAHELRTLDGTGRLKMSAGGMMMFNVNGLDNAPTADDPTLFLGGDVRANEQVGLTAMHTLFVREHNRLADEIAAQHPGFTGDQIFEHARAFVAAEMQAITYNEFLPRLLGPGAIPEYTGYKPETDASISNIFANAAYRVGHTMLSSKLLRLDMFGHTIDAGNLDLAGAFFSPGEVIDHGIEPVLRGLAAKPAQEVDVRVVDDVRNMLFGPPGSGGLDLAALNLQRGRDHGLPGYNFVRTSFGLDPVTSFSEINPDPSVWQALASVYTDVDGIDPWIGLLAEPHQDGAMVGETLVRVLADQFTRLRDGDRFWYESYLPGATVDRVNAMTLARIIRLNTTIGDELPDDVFTASPPCPAEYALPLGVVNIDDIIGFLDAFAAGAASADQDGSGELNIDDVLLFVDAFIAGCG